MTSLYNSKSMEGSHSCNWWRFKFHWNTVVNPFETWTFSLCSSYNVTPYSCLHCFFFCFFVTWQDVIILKQFSVLSFPCEICTLALCKFDDFVINLITIMLPSYIILFSATEVFREITNIYFVNLPIAVYNFDITCSITAF